MASECFLHCELWMWALWSSKHPYLKHQGCLNTGPRHWASCPDYFSWNPPSKPHLLEWSISHSLPLHVAPTLLVENNVFAWFNLSSTCKERIIYRHVSSAFLLFCVSSFQGGHSLESSAKVMFNTECGLWQCLSFTIMANYVLRRK